MNKNLSTPSKPPRVSVPVTAEVLAIFERLAKASNLSTGRAMAEWLEDTHEAAELMASTMERARAAPKVVTAELHAMMLGMADQTKELADKYRGYRGSLVDGPTGKAVRPPSVPASRPKGAQTTIPPSCNTGGKVPEQGKPRRGVKSGFPLPPAKIQAYADNNGRPSKAQK